MSNSSVSSVAFLSLTCVFEDKLHIPIQFSDCSLILDTEKFDVVWGKLIPNMFKTWSCFDEKLCHSVTLVFSIFFSIIKTQGKTFFYHQKAHLILYKTVRKLYCFKHYFNEKFQLHSRYWKKGSFYVTALRDGKLCLEVGDLNLERWFLYRRSSTPRRFEWHLNEFSSMRTFWNKWVITCQKRNSVTFGQAATICFYITSNVHRESIHLTLDWMC